jgi:hypothetical protein
VYDADRRHEREWFGHLQADQAPSGSYTTKIMRVSAAGQTWDRLTPTNGFAK